MSRLLLRSLRELGATTTRLPPTFLLPIHARGLATTTPTTPPTGSSAQTGAPPIASSEPAQPPSPSPSPPLSRLPTAPTAPAKTGATSTSVAEMYPLLFAQPRHYITVLIHGRPYLVTEGDSIRLPFLMPDVLPGDVLRLDRASTLGSRDFTLLGAPHIDPSLFECRAVVLGVETEPLRIKFKTKRRQRHVQRVKSKHRFTILRISELKLLPPP
ncbi:hypothetical protein GGS23DRAFT_85785 [Durotheca rogersii]|uniref:uncharacterized protein n=1 Tax=Durotheca rogersii TaxID=419775 RepID=UPI00221F953D|nr:uncharacterized protein GGS23DRAFT_85785 [Durotheca rogersii]KAI5862652.1 hypothetical protein GGS23DRAFT_85785 [Durotheca rogersii]